MYILDNFKKKLKSDFGHRKSSLDSCLEPLFLSLKTFKPLALSTTRLGLGQAYDSIIQVLFLYAFDNYNI